MKATLSLFTIVLLFPHVGVAQETTTTSEQDFRPSVRPLLARYCYECHARDVTEADLDLSVFATFADVRRQPKVWQKVREMLDTGQMPPKDAQQPSDVEQSHLQRWVRDFLASEARARAGDPGPVVLRRLSNAEYTYSVRDLTGVDSLAPTREFPVDGAAGEGFTNAGAAQGMSPSLVTKYLNAAKEVADHAVLLPDGIRFFRHATRRDQTDELLARIRAFYEQFTVRGNQEGRLPLENYIAATLAQRNALTSGQKTVDTVARERGLNPKYLAALWQMLTVQDDSSLLLDQLRGRWRSAEANDAPVLTAEIARWQKVLWKFNNIGHIGRAGGPPSWQEAVAPVTSQQAFKIKLPKSTDGQNVLVYLMTSDAGDGADDDYVIWKGAQLAGGDKPALLLRDAAGLQERITALRRNLLMKTTVYLAAAAEASPQTSISDLALKHDVDPRLLDVWLDYLEIGAAGPVKVKGHFQEKIPQSANYDFVRGWGTSGTPLIVANSSDQEVRIPGIARPHAIVAHPSPTVFAAVGWQSPLNGVVRVEARVADAHPECGNGVEWLVQHRTNVKIDNLWQSEFDIRGTATMPAKTIAVREGELVSFVLGPRQQSHSCDLTAVDFTITETDGDKRVWDLGKDVSDDILAGNPHADRLGNQHVWHFYKGEMKDVDKRQSLPVAPPAGSLLAAWLAAKDAGQRSKLAARVQELATGEPPAEKSSPDAVLFGHLQTLAIPLDHAALLAGAKPDPRFGKHPLGHVIDTADLVVQAPAVVQLSVPAELAEGRELTVTAHLEPRHGGEGSVQLQVLTAKPTSFDISPESPIVVAEGSEARRRVESALTHFRDLFPIAVCYNRIVPIDEVVTLTLFHREDEHLMRLMLDDEQTAELDRLWDELQFVSQEPLTYLVAFEQIREFSTQDRPDLVVAWKSLIQPANDRADAFRKRLVETEPKHLQAVLEFADRAWRRPLSNSEHDGLRDLYRQLREAEIAHQQAIRLTLARVLTSPAFLYKREQPPSGSGPAAVSSDELATRLSYFLWSSIPDDELRRAARDGTLTDDQELVTQTRRMLADQRTRRMAIQFACQWLHVRDFDKNDDKNEKLYPEFAALRGDMYEETVRFFEDMFRNEGSILGLLEADHTFLNEDLAKHYGVVGVEGPQWRRVEGVHAQQRGGILAMATLLASQSGASRTSPILRGNWVSETLLGERLPRPPANVPKLPESVPSGLTARQLIERHTSDPACAKCHARIDPYGFALEQYDAIGRLRPDAVDTKTKLFDGKTIEGIDGLRDYLSTDRRGDVVRHFCRKLLGYSLGREVQLSDEPLIDALQTKLASSDFRFSVAAEAIVLSDQFRNIRGIQTSNQPEE